MASHPVAPEIVLPAIDYPVHQVDLKTGNPCGFKATFNPTLATDRQPGNPLPTDATCHARPDQHNGGKNQQCQHEVGDIEGGVYLPTQ